MTDSNQWSVHLISTILAPMILQFPDITWVNLHSEHTHKHTHILAYSQFFNIIKYNIIALFKNPMSDIRVIWLREQVLMPTSYYETPMYHNLFMHIRSERLCTQKGFFVSTVRIRLLSSGTSLLVLLVLIKLLSCLKFVDFPNSLHLLPCLIRTKTLAWYTSRVMVLLRSSLYQ